MENQTEVLTPSVVPVVEIPADPTFMEKFSKTSRAAKMSGTFNEAAGYLKRKLGEGTDDSVLRQEGRNQELVGKVHHLVGEVRQVRELLVQKVEKTKAQ